MKTLLQIGLVFVLLCGGLIKAETTRVAASRDLRLAVVDASRPSKTRDALHTRFASLVSEVVTQRCGAYVAVRLDTVSSDRAEVGLASGAYDAVLVIGDSMSSVLQRSGGFTLSALPDSGKRSRELHLVISEGDQALQGMLAAAFPRALASEKFLTLLAATDPKATSSEGKLATAE